MSEHKSLTGTGHYRTIFEKQIKIFYIRNICVSDSTYVKYSISTHSLFKTTYQNIFNYRKTGENKCQRFLSTRITRRLLEQIWRSHELPKQHRYLGIPNSNIYRNLPESNINYRNPSIIKFTMICVNLDIYTVK